MAPNFFLVVERGGGCSNPTKVRNAQNFGATVALIADYREEPLDYIVMEDMAGSTNDLVIPGYMIDY